MPTVFIGVAKMRKEKIMSNKPEGSVCINCGFPYYIRNNSSDIKGFCSQGCLRRKARRLGWVEKKGVTVLEFMKSRKAEV